MDIPAIDIPEKNSIPKTGTLPDYHPNPTNFAGNKKKSIQKTIENFRARAYANLTRFQGQGVRRDQEDRIKLADRFYRCSQDRDSASDQYYATRSNFSTDLFYRGIRAISASMTAVFFPNEDDLPVEYVPDPYADTITQENAQTQADCQNAVQSMYWNIDDRRRKIEESLPFLNAYGNQMYAIEWELMHRQLVLKERDAQGKIRKIKKRVPVKNNPRLRLVDFADVWFDSTVIDDADTDGMQVQMCILERDRPNYLTLIDAQREGHYANIEQVTTQQKMTGSDENTVRQDRQANADESESGGEPTGQFVRWRVHMVCPIDPETGIWDEKKNLPSKWIGTFVGDLGRQDAVCVQLLALPYWRNEWPYRMVHTHPDNKGMYHMGHVDIVRGRHEEILTSENQWCDNKDLQNRAPWIEELGTIMTEDKTFDPNKIFTVQPGGMQKFQRLDVPSITNDMLPFLQDLREEYKKSMQTDRPLSGETFPPRTVATDVQHAYEQATKVALMGIRYVERQLFPWIAEWDRDLSRQYGDPQMRIAVTRLEHDPVETTLGQLIMPLVVRPVATARFERTMLQRNALNKLLQTVLPFSAQWQGREGMIELVMDVFKAEGLENVQRYFPPIYELDAVSNAKNENYKMAIDGEEESVAPKQGQNHKIHQREHQIFYEDEKSRAELSADRLAIIERHIAATDALMQQEERGMTGGQAYMQQRQLMAEQGGGEAPVPPAGAPAPAAVPPAETAPTRMEGEAAGDMMAEGMGGEI